MSDTFTGDPTLSFHFELDLNGISGYFASVDGLGSESEMIEQKITDAQGLAINRRIPGRLTWGDITLKRGVTANIDFFEWMRAAVASPMSARRDGSIILYDAEKTEIARWNFEKAWPSKVSGPSFSADSSEVMMEEVILVHEYIERAN